MSKKSKKEALAVGRESLSEALHTALRKCCDSKATSLLWNLIFKVDAGAWDLYLDHVWLKLQIATARDASYPFWRVLKDASISFDGELPTGRDRNKIDFTSVALLDITFGMMDDGDWQGFAAYLVHNA